MLELLHKAMFALIAGFSELTFVSTEAHQWLYRTLTGYELSDSFLSFGIHLGCLAALLLNCYQRIKYLRSQKRLHRPGKRRHVRQPDVVALIDIRILNTAVVPLMLGLLFRRRAMDWCNGSLGCALALILNGIVLFAPRLLRSGNKDARSFTRLDGVLMGIGGVLGIFPGFSRLGCMYSVGTARGAQGHYVLELGILLSIPVVGALLCMDLYSCTVALAGVTGLQLIGALVAALTAFAGACAGLKVIRFVCDHSTATVFAYYSWGLAMFLLLIYLFVS